MTKIAIIGGGKIGEALLSGLCKAGYDDIVVTNRSAERGAELADVYGVRTSTDNAAAVEGAYVVFVAVKPYAVTDALGQLASALKANAQAGADTVVVSLAAGVSLDSLAAAAGRGAVVRVMPNTPMLLGHGMSAVSCAEGVTQPQRELVCELLATVGEVVEVEEKQMDAVTAIAGSAPAYFFLVAEALIDAGVQLGLTRDVAQQLAAQTAKGAGIMLADAGVDPVTLRANVTSPGGTTAAALRELEESGLRGAFFRAAQACADRSRELG